MGISGLMKIISTKRVNLSDLSKFKVIGIDTSIWLHKCKYADGCELANNINDSGWLNSFKAIFSEISKTSSLVFVFDGKTPDIKLVEHNNRRNGFDKMHEVALKLLEIPQMKHEGKRMLVKLIEVSDLSSKLQTMIDEQGWGRVSADFEADTLLASMALQGKIDLIITNDTDLVVYGCENILFKFTGSSGHLYNKSEFESVFPFKSWRLFQCFCILSGCDYFKATGIGPGKARKICKDQTSFQKWYDGYDNASEFDKCLSNFTI